MNNTCPECAVPLKYQAKSCVCGWGKGKQSQQFAAVDRHRCAWTDGYVTCPLPPGISLDMGRKWYCGEHALVLNNPRLCRQIAEDARANPKPVTDWRNDVMRTFIDKHGLSQVPGETKGQHVERCKAFALGVPAKPGIPTREEQEAEIEHKRRGVQNFGPLLPADTRAKIARGLCDNPAFLDWAGVADKQEAANMIRGICKINSSVELDQDAQAGALFDEQVRRPFFDAQSSEAA